MLYRDFDSTCGFPVKARLQLSHKIGSLNAHPKILLSCLLFRRPGSPLRPLLPVTPDVNGVRRVERGGLATLSQDCLVYDAMAAEDVTGYLPSMSILSPGVGCFGLCGSVCP